MRLTPSIVCAQDQFVGIVVEEWRGSEEFEHYEQEIEIADMDAEALTPPEPIAASQVGSPCLRAIRRRHPMMVGIWPLGGHVL
eukprot:7067680-Prymnesium_polylepis.2